MRAQQILKTIIPLIIFSTLFGFSQSKKILVYHETNGFRHRGAINDGIPMFEDLGNENGEWVTNHSQDSNVFTVSNLAQYDVVVFLNTSGDGLLSNTEQDAFEDFIASGKGFVGIHAATDTYRDKSWPFYNELVGAIVQTSPNHTQNNFNADMEVKSNSPIIDFLGPVGSIWNKDEEYYYWERDGGQLSNDNTVLLEVESTGNNSYDAARPITWHKESITYDDDNNSATPDVTLTGIKSFYTAMGHNGSDFSGDTNFRTMLKNAILWASNSDDVTEPPCDGLVENNPNKFFKIKTRHNKSIEAGYTGNQLQEIYQFENNDSENQKWMLNEIEDNSYMIKNVLTNKCMEAPDSNLNGSSINQNDCNQNDVRQHWEINPTSNCMYYVKSKATNRCLDLESGSNLDGADIQQWGCADINENRSFSFELTEISSSLSNNALLKDNANNLFIYPNPTDELLNITTSTRQTFNQLDVSVYDLSGRLLISKSFTDESLIKLSVNKLNTGQYLVKVKIDNKPKHLFFIKK